MVCCSLCCNSERDRLIKLWAFECRQPDIIVYFSFKWAINIFGWNCSLLMWSLTVIIGRVSLRKSDERAAAKWTSTYHTHQIVNSFVYLYLHGAIVSAEKLKGCRTLPQQLRAPKMKNCSNHLSVLCGIPKWFRVYNSFFCSFPSRYRLNRQTEGRKLQTSKRIQAHMNVKLMSSCNMMIHPKTAV